jgi:hypothetical protein
MKLRVTLDAFSGLPNPHWIWEPTASELREVIERVETADEVPARLKCGLGYRGLIVERLQPGPWPERRARFNRSLVRQSRDARVWLDPGAVVEQRLLATAPATVPGAVLASARAAVGEPPLSTDCQQPDPPPPFDPGPWHRPAELNVNNCYNYAANSMVSEAAPEETRLARENCAQTCCPTSSLMASNPRTPAG